MRRQLLTVAFLTGLSQAAAFFKLWFVARIFGVGTELDGYNLALVIPTFVAAIASSLIQTGFFPVRAAYRLQASDDAVHRFERTVVWLAVGVGGLASMLIILAYPWLTGHLVSSELIEARKVVEEILPFVAILILLNIATDTMGYVLAMHNRFVYAAAAPIVNGLLGALCLILWPEHGLQSLVGGTILGVFSQLVVCAVGLKTLNFAFIGPLLISTELAPLLRKMLRLSFWILPGVIFSNITTSMPMVWAAQFGEGAASIFGYAYRLHLSVVQLLVMASSTIILAHFSTLVANNQTQLVRAFLINSALFSFGIGLLSVACIWLIGAPLLATIFAGRFDTLAADQVSVMWTWLTAGLAFALLGNVFAKLWQAQGRTKLMSVMAGISLIILTATFLLFRNTLESNSIGLALTLASASVVIFGVFLLGNNNKSRL